MDPPAETAIGSIELQFDDDPPRAWRVAVARITTGALGDPALYFELVESEKADLEAWTRKNLHRRITMHIGSEVIAYATLAGPLPGHAVVEPGGEVWSEDYVRLLVAQIAGRP